MRRVITNDLVEVVEHRAVDQSKNWVQGTIDTFFNSSTSFGGQKTTFSNGVVTTLRKKVEQVKMKTILSRKNKSTGKIAKKTKAMATCKLKMGAKSLTGKGQGKEWYDSSQRGIQLFFGKSGDNWNSHGDYKHQKTSTIASKEESKTVCNAKTIH